jgi:23S rRNA U2552 (ribose-2'-O)-methylase RlmE/FtsJ
VKRNTADYPTDNDKIGFFKMTQRVGAELNRRTGCMNIHDQPVRKNNLILEFPAILDLGIAPGGFSATAMQANPTAILRAVTLDPKEGGHDVMLYQRDYNNDVHIEFMDRTMLAGEMGLGMNEVPVGHPEAKKLNHDLIFPEIDEFDLVFCGGTPTRNHRQHQAPYREFVEGLRLSVSQLVIALNHIREGGTIVMLMHRPETWITCQSMYMLSKFSEIRPFKPRAAHKTKSSFYLIATDVKPRSIEAQDAVRRWKATWKHLTINTHGLHDVTIAELEDTELAGETVEEVLRNFGAQLVNKSRTIWLEQAEALKNAPWLRKGQKAAGGGRAEGSGGNKAQV